MDRWVKHLGPKKDQQQQNGDGSSTTGMSVDTEAATAAGGLRRGVRNAPSRYKEPPTPQTPSVQMMPPPGQVPPLKFDALSKKQIRRGCLMEAMRRTVKKREVSGNKSRSRTSFINRTRRNPTPDIL